MQALPLFMGSLLELGEWEILTLLISHLGGPEGKKPYQLFENDSSLFLGIVPNHVSFLLPYH